MCFFHLTIFMIVIRLYSLVSFIMLNAVFAKHMCTGHQMYNMFNGSEGALKGNQPDTYNSEMAFSRHFPKLKSPSYF